MANETTKYLLGRRAQLRDPVQTVANQPLASYFRRVMFLYVEQPVVRRFQKNRRADSAQLTAQAMAAVN